MDNKIRFDVENAVIITPGFRLLFEYEGQQHEYHTDQDGSSVVGCGGATRPESGSTAEPTRTLGETAPDEEPSTFNDSANLAADPEVAGNSNSVRFGYGM